MRKSEGLTPMLLLTLLVTTCTCILVAAAVTSKPTRQHEWNGVEIHCKDKGRNCEFLEKLKYCRLAPGHMYTFCMQTCGFCGPRQSFNGWKIHIKV